MKEKIKILLIGSSGQVGWELNRTLALLGQVVAIDYPIIDLSQPRQIQQQIQEIKPDLIINAAAYTAVDQAEKEPELAMAINAIAPAIMASEAKGIGAVLIHYSTDYVFDGTKDEPYTENDQPDPLNVYGQSKLAGDKAIIEIGGPHLILRTSWVYGNRGKNFMLTILRLAREREEIRVVDDQTGAPTWCRMLAEATAQIIIQGLSDLPEFFQEKGGLYNLSGKGQTSWFGFAKAILEYDPNKEEQRPVHLLPIPGIEFQTLARRPAYSVLSSLALQNTFGLKIPEWEECLRLVLAKG